MSVRFLTRHRVVASSIFFLWDCIYSIETKQEQPEFLVPLVVVSQVILFFCSLSLFFY